MTKVIEVRDLSKLYRLGEIGTGTISRDINQWWAKMRGKDDPYKKIGERNDRTSIGNSEYVWSLKDINFDVHQGDVLGIIGKNGAGKSTLLKILSRITAPTTGHIRTKGRIASLLEVGTGFHPDLTGRENIYLNGAIMGMRKAEVKKKFDDIVEFSGVARYIDTPVKRYSSGMYVRLAFAVAAHLEPEILIVDEVLAVGDAEFQKKCLGKMKDVTEKEGRTVLFVSHNMGAVAELCTKGLLLEHGEVKVEGNITETVNQYVQNNKNLKSEVNFEISTAPGDENAKLLSVKIIGSEKNYFINVTDKICIEIKYLDFNVEQKNTAVIHLKDVRGNVLFASSEFNNPSWSEYHKGTPSIITAKCYIPGNFLAEGEYSVLAAIVSYSPNKVHALVDDIIGFSVSDLEIYGQPTVKNGTYGVWPGLVRPLLKWEIENIEYYD